MAKLQTTLRGDLVAVAYSFPASSSGGSRRSDQSAMSKRSGSPGRRWANDRTATFAIGLEQERGFQLPQQLAHGVLCRFGWIWYGFSGPLLPRYFRRICRGKCFGCSDRLDGSTVLFKITVISWNRRSPNFRVTRSPHSPRYKGTLLKHQHGPREISTMATYRPSRISYRGCSPRLWLSHRITCDSCYVPSWITPTNGQTNSCFTDLGKHYPNATGETAADQEPLIVDQTSVIHWMALMYQRASGDTDFVKPYIGNLPEICGLPGG